MIRCSARGRSAAVHEVAERGLARQDVLDGLRVPLAPLHGAGVELGAAVIGAGYPLAVEAGRLGGAGDLPCLVCQDAAGYLADDAGGYLVYLDVWSIFCAGDSLTYR